MRASRIVSEGWSWSLLLVLAANCGAIPGYGFLESPVDGFINRGGPNDMATRGVGYGVSDGRCWPPSAGWLLGASESGVLLRVAEEVLADVDPVLPGLRRCDVLSSAEPSAFRHTRARVADLHRGIESLARASLLILP